MAISSDFSEESQAMTVEERFERFKASRVRDRSELPPEVRAAFEQADREMAEEWAGKLPKPVVIDKRTKKL